MLTIGFGRREKYGGLSLGCFTSLETLRISDLDAKNIWEIDDPANNWPSVKEVDIVLDSAEKWYRYGLHRNQILGCLQSVLPGTTRLSVDWQFQNDGSGSGSLPSPVTGSKLAYSNAGLLALSRWPKMLEDIPETLRSSVTCHIEARLSYQSNELSKHWLDDEWLRQLSFDLARSPTGEVTRRISFHYRGRFYRNRLPVRVVSLLVGLYFHAHSFY